MKKYLFGASVLVGLDQLIKHLALQHFTTPISIFSNIFSLVLRFNKGIAFSISIPEIILYPLLSLIIISGSILAYYYINWENKILASSIALIWAGGIGNIIDRFLYGHVIDFIKIGNWPVFNLADSFISIGAGLLIIYLIKHKD